MSPQHVFYLARRDILATTHNDIVQPSLDEKIALLVKKPRIFGRKPTIRVKQVLPHVLTGNLVSAHMDLARMAGRAAFAVRLANFKLDRRQRLPDRTQPAADDGIA